MRIVTTSYSKRQEFNNPQDWLKRIGFYTGILEQLAKQHEVISIERINYQGTYQQNGIQYHFVQLNENFILFPWRLHRFIKKQQPDVVLVHGFIFPLQIIQLALIIGKKAKIIVQNHAEKPSSGVKKIFQQIADRYISTYLFTAKEMGKEWVEKGIIANNKKIVEIMEVSSSFHFIGDKENIMTEISSRAVVFLWVGRLNANKDPLTIVKAFIRFVSFQPAAELYMIYQAEELLQEVKELIGSNAKAKDAIKLVGQVPNEHLQAWYNRAGFFISGSHYESGGVAVCEAMSCGCIPIVTDILSFRKITGPGKCGLLYEPGNDKELLKCLFKTTKMDIRKERNKVFQQFKEELSFDAIAGKIDKAMASL